MGRHASARKSFAISTWLISVIAIIALLLVAGSVWLLSSRGGQEGDSSAAADSSQTTAAQTTAPATSVAPSSTESSQSSSAAPTPQAPQDSKATALDTLVLIDTSEAMAPGFESVSAALSGTAQTLGTDGKSVALWNYSSPLSPGATVGYRDNLGFGDGNAVAGTLDRFGTGGVPQTRSAVLAALDSASQRSAESGQDTRVLVVTTGTQQDMDDASFRDALASRKGDSVKLSVVTIGGEKDALLGELADSHAEVTDVNDSAALNKALAQATGV